LGYFFHGKKLRIKIWKKYSGYATLWANFSPTHLITLALKETLTFYLKLSEQI
jgi:hypothetical protein